jgi:hypothetical protein
MGLSTTLLYRLPVAPTMASTVRSFLIAGLH